MNFERAFTAFLIVLILSAVVVFGAPRSNPCDDLHMQIEELEVTLRGPSTIEAVSHDIVKTFRATEKALREGCR